MQLSGGTYFSGGEGVGVAMRAMGIEHKFGVEFNPAIADVARSNGFEMLTANVCDVDPASLPRVDIFHGSPVCKNASNAKTDAKESPEDVATALAFCAYIDYHKPRSVTLENVWGYRKRDAFAAILKTLTRCGYRWDYWHLNSADYGVPQTRKRLILIASLGFQPRKPRETHTNKPVAMFETLEKWDGWETAIESVDGLERWEPTERVTRLYPCPMPDYAVINAKDTNFSSVPQIVFPCGGPVFSLTVQHGNTGIAVFKDGRHYLTTPRIRADWHSLPKDYKFPANTNLAYKVIGNAVPPKLYEAVLKSILECLP